MITHQIAGNGDPVLLLNGGFMTMMAWEPIAAPLAADHRVIRCDFRGQMMSPGQAPPTLEGHVDDVVAVLDALKVDAAHVIGTSFGGFVAVEMAGRRPDRVLSLVLVATAEQVTDETWRAGLPVVEACRAAAEGRGDGGRILDLLAPVTYSPDYLEANAAVMQQRRAFVSALPPQYFAGHCGLLQVLNGLDVRRAAAAVCCPALVLAAEHDRTFPFERSRALANAIPGATLEVIPGAHHGVVIEDPQTVLAHIRAFLGRSEDIMRRHARNTAD